MSMTSMTKAAGLGVALTATLFATGPASAATFDYFLSCGPSFFTVDAPAAFDSACPTAFGTSSGSARGDFGSIGASAQVLQNNPSQTVPSSYSGQVTYRDTIIFSDPNSGSTNIAVNLLLDGITALNSVDGNLSSTILRGHVMVNYNYFFFMLSSFGGAELGAYSVVGGQVNALGVTDALLQTPLFNVPTNTPLDFHMSLSANAAVVGGTAAIDFGNTFQVPIDRPAFVLANGVTANSGTWLVDNRRVVASVPEPGTWAMFIVGFGAIGAIRRRQRRCTGAAT